MSDSLIVELSTHVCNAMNDEHDVVMNAEILSYSRAKGLFAGVSLEGSTLRSDGSANENLYGHKLSARDIIRRGKVKTPASAAELVSLLDKKSPKNRSDPKSLE